MTRRLLAVASLVALCGCSSGNNLDFAQYFKVLKDSADRTLARKDITLQEATAIPYASMGWRLNGGPQNLVVLATDTAGDQLWTSSAHVVILTHDGRIKRTVGLPHDLGALATQNSPLLIPPSQALRGHYEQRLDADFPDIGTYGVTIFCRGAVAGRQSITILGKTLATSRVDEICSASKIGWSFTNSYWVDADSGFTWRSTQHIHPNGDLVQTETLRPPG